METEKDTQGFGPKGYSKVQNMVSVVKTFLVLCFNLPHFCTWDPLRKNPRGS